MINANGSGRSDAVETFTGTVSGIPGTLTIDNSAAANPAGALRATDVIVGGTGQLAGISGVLHEVGTVPPCATCFPVSTYTGELQ
jgi:hypothetical protein